MHVELDVTGRPIDAVVEGIGCSVEVWRRSWAASPIPIKMFWKCLQL